MPREIDLDAYLRTLREGGNHLEGATPAMDAQFTVLGQAVAAFMDLCRSTEGIGYAYGRQVMEEMTHLFPTPPRPTDNGAVREVGGGMAVVDLAKATDDQLREISERSGIPFARLKAAQAMKRASNAARSEAPKPFDNTPTEGTGVTDWAAMEAQFHAEDEKGAAS